LLGECIYIKLKKNLYYGSVCYRGCDENSGFHYQSVLKGSKQQALGSRQKAGSRKNLRSLCAKKFHTENAEKQRHREFIIEKTLRQAQRDNAETCPDLSGSQKLKAKKLWIIF
jgi:hypothetical protein